MQLLSQLHNREQSGAISPAYFGSIAQAICLLKQQACHELTHIFKIRNLHQQVRLEIDYVDDLEFHLNLGKDQFLDRLCHTPYHLRKVSGGGGGNRTLVQKLKSQSIYILSLQFEFTFFPSCRRDEKEASSF